VELIQPKKKFPASFRRGDNRRLFGSQSIRSCSSSKGKFNQNSLTSQFFGNFRNKFNN
jgi:hypothetical protein